MPEHPFVFEYKDYPLIPIKFQSKDRETPCIDALLDSGGDFIVIPYAIAKYLKLKLEKAGCVDTAGGETTLCKSVLNMVIFDEKNEKGKLLIKGSYNFTNNAHFNWEDIEVTNNQTMIEKFIEQHVNLREYCTDFKPA